MKWALYSSGLLKAGSSIVGALSTIFDTNMLAGRSLALMASLEWKLTPPKNQNQPEQLRCVENRFFLARNY